MQFAARRFCLSGQSANVKRQRKARQAQRAFRTEKPKVLDEVGNLMEVLQLGEQVKQHLRVGVQLRLTER